MTPRRALLLVIWLIISVWQANARADVECSPESTALSHTFTSGARWSVCARISAHHSPEFEHLSYQAPGDRLRSVLLHLHPAAILLHYHDEPEPREQLRGTNGRVLTLSEQHCSGGAWLLPDDTGAARLCATLSQSRTLAKYAQRPSLHGQHWSLHGAFQRDGLVWIVGLTLTEDGQIRPSISLSGRPRTLNSAPQYSSTLPDRSAVPSPEGLPRATVLVNWRMVFDLDSGGIDRVEQFDFPLLSDDNNRRPMQVTAFDNEVFTTVNRNQFRGWRVVDPAGAGYYLEPFDNGFDYRNPAYTWTNHDLAVSRLVACERYSLVNRDCSGAVTLDEVVNGEPLGEQHPVLWFSQSRTLSPTLEDWPVISDFVQSLTLTPFDWTAASPFELIE